MSISFNNRDKLPVRETGAAKQTFIGKEYSFVFILTISRIAVFKYLKLKCEKIITAQNSIHHCTFSIHLCTSWPSLHLKLILEFDKVVLEVLFLLCKIENSAKCINICFNSHCFLEYS